MVESDLRHRMRMPISPPNSDGSPLQSLDIAGSPWGSLAFLVFPWSSLEFTRASGDYRDVCDTTSNYPWNTPQKLCVLSMKRPGIPWNSLEFPGAHWSSQEFTGFPWSSLEFLGPWNLLNSFGDIAGEFPGTPWNSRECSSSVMEFPGVPWYPLE